MSIADKITSIEGHLIDDYEGLENLGADLTNVNKNIQNIRTCLDTIYDNLPKTTGEGSNLSLTTLKGRINTEAVKGDTTQAILPSAYQQVEYIESTGTQYINTGISGTFSNNIVFKTKFVVTQTASREQAVLGSKNSAGNGLTMFFGENGLQLKTWCGSGTTMNVTTLSSTTEINSVEATFYKTTGRKIIVNGTTYQDTTIGNTYTSNTENFGLFNDRYDELLSPSYLKLYSFEIIKDNVQVRNFIPCYRISDNVIGMYDLVSNTFFTNAGIGTFTKGSNAPTPSSPQDIEVVTGQQEVVVQSANYFKPQLKVNGTDITQVRCAVTLQDDEFTFVASGNDMYFGNVGTSGTSYGNNRGTLIKLPTNASKVYVTTTNTDFNANYICWYDENKTTLGFILSNSAGNSIPSSAKYMNVRIGKADSVSGTTYKTKVMVRIDDNTTSYIEHQEQTKTLHLGDIELAKIGTYQDRIFETSGKNLTELSSISTTGGGYINYSVSQLAEVEQGKTYTLSLKNNTSYTSNLNVRISSGGTYTTETQGNLVANGITSYTFTASQSGTLNLNSRLGTTDITNALTQITLNYGSSALPYEPYGSDKWYIEKKIGKVLLKDVPQGTKNWTKSNAYSTNDYFCGFCGFGKIKTNSYYILCNKLVNAIYSDTTTSECIANDSESVNLKIKASRLSENSPTGLANYLANEGSDIYILYILKTPTYEEITNETLIEELNEIEKMMSYNGQTNISISGNLPMLLSVSALKGE